MSTITGDAGTLTARWTLHDADWATNDRAYNLAVYHEEAATIKGIKHRDKTLELVVTGPYERSFTFEGMLPASVRADDLHVVVTWDDGAIRVYVDGEVWKSI